jgi:hypothetical protein
MRQVRTVRSTSARCIVSSGMTKVRCSSSANRNWPTINKLRPHTFPCVMNSRNSSPERRVRGRHVQSGRMPTHQDDMQVSGAAARPCSADGCPDLTKCRRPEPGRKRRRFASLAGRRAVPGPWRCLKPTTVQVQTGTTAHPGTSNATASLLACLPSLGPQNDDRYDWINSRGLDS